MADLVSARVRLSGAIACLAIVTACGSPYRDAVEIDGTWVGRKEPPCADWAAPDSQYCDAIVAYAWSQTGRAGAITARVRLFGAPERMADGTLIARGAAPTYVVFEFADGQQDLVSVIQPSDDVLSRYGYSAPGSS